MAALAGGGIRALTSEPPSLEDLFLRALRTVGRCPMTVATAPGTGTVAGHAPDRGGGRFLGTGRLVRLALRRDRFLLPALGRWASRSWPGSPRARPSGSTRRPPSGSRPRTW